MLVSWVYLICHARSLKQLYAMSMDVHARFRTESHQDVVARFNERFILSLANCRQCLVLDDELNILPLSSHVRHIQPIVLAHEVCHGGCVNGCAIWCTVFIWVYPDVCCSEPECERGCE